MVAPTLEKDGGVQLSGQVAWGALNRDANGASPRLLELRGTGVAAKLQFAARACGLRTARRPVIFWHLHLTTSLPLVASSPSRSALFLHGIEAWRPLTPLVRRCIHKMDQLWSNSDYTWERFIATHPEFAQCRHRTIPLGLGTEEPSAPLPDAGEPVALMLSRLDAREAYKGHREVIACWPKVLRQLPNARLWIAGEGGLRPELERQAAALGVSGSVTLFGRISEERKQEFVRACRCLVLPSRGEGFGLVYLEAMRLGRPCLVSTLDAGREVINPPEAGLAAHPDDPDALADALCRLLRGGDEWRTFSFQAHRRYRENYTAAQFGDRLLASIQNL